MQEVVGAWVVIIVVLMGAVLIVTYLRRREARMREEAARQARNQEDETPSEHLMYRAWSSRGLKYITANQAGTVVVDASSTSMHVFVAKEAFAHKQFPFTFYAEALRGWYWGSI